MRRTSGPKPRESEYLDAAIERLEHDAALIARADAEIAAVSSQEPLFAQSLRAPQSPPHHCEGPFVEHHVRRILVVLYAIAAGKLHLRDIEEFKRLKGYEEEIQELEERIKENIALFECFALVHDAAKWATLSFTSLERSRGRQMGFDTEAMAHWHDIGASERAKMRSRYLELYDAFASDRPQEPDRALQQEFFLLYGIQCHYPGHDRMIHAPLYHGLLHRVCEAHRLTDRDAALLEDMIGSHMDVNLAFAPKPNPAAIDRFVNLAETRGYDSDDFLDLLQGCVLLDMTFGSARRSEGMMWHDHTPVANFLRAEHDYAPWKRQEKAARRAEEKKRERNRHFREAGLDGVALMEVLRMEAGPRFGKALAIVHAAVLGEAPWPASMPADMREEIEKRAGKFYELTFEKGDDSD